MSLKTDVQKLSGKLPYEVRRINEDLVRDFRITCIANCWETPLLLTAQQGYELWVCWWDRHMWPERNPLTIEEFCLAMDDGSGFYVVQRKGDAWLHGAFFMPIPYSHRLTAYVQKGKEFQRENADEHRRLFPLMVKQEQLKGVSV